MPFKTNNLQISYLFNKRTNLKAPVVMQLFHLQLLRACFAENGIMLLCSFLYSVAHVLLAATTSASKAWPQAVGDPLFENV